jgi:uncharacterized protein (TIRG00374 family)
VRGTIHSSPVTRNKAFWARTAVSLAICSVLFWWIDWSGVGEMLRQAKGYWLLAALIAVNADRLLMAYKWRMLLSGSNTALPMKVAVQAYYVGEFWSQFLPSSVGADAARIVWLMRRIGSGPAIISSIVVERILGALALAIVALVAVGLFTMYSSSNVSAFLTIVLLLLLVTALALAMIFSEAVHRVAERLISKLPLQRLSHTVESVRVAVLSFREKPGLLATFLSLSLLEQAFPILANFLVVRALSIDLPFLWLVMGVPIALIVARAPVSVHGWGVQEGAYAVIFSTAGIPPSDAVLMSLAGRVLAMLSSLPGAVWSLAARERELPVASAAPGPEGANQE